MASVNKVILVGNLGRDPDLRYSPDGTPICNLSIATTRFYKDSRSGDRVEETEWHRVVMYSRLAEVAGEYLKKGRSVYLEGRLKTRKWQDKHTGADRYSTEIIADQMQMLRGPADDNDGGRGRAQPAPQRTASPPAGTGTPAAPVGGSPYDDDIPFAPYATRRAAYCM